MGIVSCGFGYVFYASGMHADRLAIVETRQQLADVQLRELVTTATTVSAIQARQELVLRRLDQINADLIENRTILLEIVQGGKIDSHTN